MKVPRILKSLVVGGIVSALGGVGASADEWQDVVDAAKAEGKVVLYLAKSNAQAEALLKAFEAEYGITGEWLRGSARAQTSRLMGELQAGAPQADVFYTAGPISHSRIAEQTPV
ncbi:MAG: hypothetical protein OXI81_01705 [Paracoccaceae bacterium]|nr:hypothetical protein [Paracoccaceae bacterium]